MFTLFKNKQKQVLILMMMDLMVSPSTVIGLDFNVTANLCSIFKLAY